jgi:hypothetical protein
MKNFALLVVILAFALSLGVKGTAHGAIHDDEVPLLQKLSAQLVESAASELEKVEQLSRSGRYNESELLTKLNSFAETTKALNTIIQTIPIVEADLNQPMSELKSLVLGIDDIFVYESGYDHVRRDWNECKRILRRLDGVIYRAGVLRRIEHIIDANQWFKEIGYFFGMHGALSKAEDTLHGDKMFQPVNDVVGRHGGGRNTTNVWHIPQPQHHAVATQNRSSFNEDLSEF